MDATCVQIGLGGRELHPEWEEFPQIYGSHVIYNFFFLHGPECLCLAAVLKQKWPRMHQILFQFPFFPGVKKVKEADLYIAPLLKSLTLKVLRYGSHSATCKLHRTCLYLVSIHQMAHPRLRLRTSNCSLLLIYLPSVYPSVSSYMRARSMRNSNQILYDQTR